MVAQIDKIYLMQLFVQIVHLGTFSAAAQKMGVTPSKASKDIQQLEKTLGSVLLNRSTRSIGITSAGELYYDTAIEVLASYDGLIDNLNYIKNRLTGELRLTAPELWGNIVLSPLIFEFKKIYPDVSIRANYSNEVIDLFRENTHIAFRSTTLRNEPYLSKRICSDDTVLCASPEYLQRTAIPKKLDDLSELDFITFSQTVNTYNSLEFMINGVEQRVTVNGSLSFNSKKSIYDAVLNHLGVASLPSYLVKQNLLEGHLVQVLPEFHIQSLYFYAFYMQRKKESILITTFVDFIQESIQKNEG
ncbi:LysR family transcriptional regulator [Kiloniella antarctica]|uniref:LysR family transcriptional regulator n=1 Tax=Kiloniella antarctica TaxID=1550907 RepID=A0ABW5BL88_9PROT